MSATADPPGLDLAALRRHLDEVRPGLVAGPLRAALITGGRSNLTYDLTDGTHRWALRRPPLGHVLATAHDMGREHRVISALSSLPDRPVPVPDTVLLSTDSSVLGAPFYLMDFVEGRVLKEPGEEAELGPVRFRALAERLVDTLAALHGVDPAAAGLADFGRPEGYLERQVRRWTAQLAQSRSREVEGFDELRDRLAKAVPDTQRSTIVHGDFRLANAIVAPAEPAAGESGTDRIAAVLDWEMSTLGDPLVDVAILQLYSQPPAEAGSLFEIPLPDVDALLDRYADRTGLDLAPLPWYSAFAHFKLAVILEGIHFRYGQGKTVGPGFEDIGERVPPLVRSGLAVLSGEGRTAG